MLSVSTTIPKNKSTGNTPEIQSDVVTRKENSPEVKNDIRPTLQNVLLITERNNVDQAPGGKELDLLSESSRFPGTQRALLSGVRDVGHAIQKEEDHQGKFSSDCTFEEECYHQAAGPAHNTGRLKGRGLRLLSQWCHYLAWTLCLLGSLSCLVLSALLGLR